MPNPPFSESQIPSLEDKIIIVTGANSGIGFEAARAFAEAKATVVLACRNVHKAEEAASRIRTTAPDAAVSCIALNLADLTSVDSFCAEFARRFTRLDVLCNNAGVMATPYCLTKDGFEMQIGTNHLGHFALTGQLLEVLLGTPHSRVVTVSSLVYQVGKIRLDDLHYKRGRYVSWLAYGQSKLANLLFTHELTRRLPKADESTIALSCHPGYAATNLQTAGLQLEGFSLQSKILGLTNRIVAQTPGGGALPTMYAAVGDVQGGDFIGPGGPMQMSGPPVVVSAGSRARDTEVAQALWQLSVEATGQRYAGLD